MSLPIEKRKSIHYQLYQIIKERIIRGTYNPGERLYEAKLARELNISRSPVREALRLLENEGLLIQDEQSRIFVYEPSSVDVEHIYQCRQVLESLAASLAAENASDKELNEILDTALHSQMTVDEDCEENKYKLIELNSHYHDLIIQYSKNPRLKKQVNSLRTLTFFYRRLNVDDPRRRKQIVEQHIEIAHAIAARDKDKAASLMNAHIRTDMEFLIGFLK
ncbi:GntR family transcriptional regulator [Jeotgalibacillus proteolyticus]|uniref:GntR family transcriptional regulator n=1 Tax=Jeotgalibacillus proteolyticus TaxID=2082395 RepID=A0A2S5GEL3_9BACL|nr:GntR family transcriptional regulator [Jeotgalibacillus proteolyticus]PPA71344.1 GntR family transcriptional regulator [Jeotgalibacillus proteolyticus]